MINRFIGILAPSVGLFAVSYQAQAYDMNVEVDIKTSTSYPDCQPYADNIVDLVEILVECESHRKAAFISEQIVFLKKQLKKCEKMNKKKTTDIDIGIGVGHKYEGKS